MLLNFADAKQVNKSVETIFKFGNMKITNRNVARTVSREKSFLKSKLM